MLSEQLESFLHEGYPMEDDVQRGKGGALWLHRMQIKGN